MSSEVKARSRAGGGGTDLGGPRGRAAERGQAAQAGPATEQTQAERGPAAERGREAQGGSVAEQGREAERGQAGEHRPEAEQARAAEQGSAAGREAKARREAEQARAAEQGSAARREAKAKQGRLTQWRRTAERGRAFERRAAERGRAGERGRDKLAPGLLAGALGVFIAVGISACNTNPHAADVPPPSTVEQQAGPGQTPDNASSEHHSKPKPGIQLPNTIQVLYATTPAFQDLTHHIVLWNAAQAYKAEYAAAYQPASAATADLKRYWAGAGYQQAHTWAQNWIDTKHQPVGQAVLSNVSVESLSAEQATVGFCEDLAGVVRGDVQTHTPGKALQERNTLGNRIVYIMVPTGSKGQWQVNAETITKASALCPPPTEKKRHH